MFRVKSPAIRRGAGFAAAVVIAGGLAGTVLLTPGTAFAATQVPTSTSISVSQQSNGFGGKTLDVSIAVTAVGAYAPTGVVNVSVFGQSYTCTADLVLPSSGDTSTGNCSLGWVPNGTYGVYADYSPNLVFEGSDSSTHWVGVSGSSNPGNPGGHHGHISTSLSCPSSVSNSGTGTCTLTVTNDWWYGYGSASDVTAQISLPRQLHANSCVTNNQGQPYGHPWGWNGGCSINGNTAWANLGSLGQGGSQTLSVTFTGHTHGHGWNWYHSRTVTVTGTARANNNQGSTSTAQVTIYPYNGAHPW
jgi:hypothetical protein